MTIGPRLQTEIVSAGDSTTTLNVIFDPESGSIAIDYSLYYERIATAVETLASLAQGSGVNMKGPQDWIGLISTYKLYVENEGPDKMTLAEFAEYFSKVDSLPKSF